MTEPETPTRYQSGGTILSWPSFCLNQSPGERERYVGARMTRARILRAFSGRARKGRRGSSGGWRAGARRARVHLGDGGRWKVTWPATASGGDGGGKRWWKSRDFYAVVRKCCQFRRNSRAIRASANGCPPCRVWPALQSPAIILPQQTAPFAPSGSKRDVPPPSVPPFVRCARFSRLFLASCPNIVVAFLDYGLRKWNWGYFVHEICKMFLNCRDSFHLRSVYKCSFTLDNKNFWNYNCNNDKTIFFDIVA